MEKYTMSDIIATAKRCQGIEIALVLNFQEKANAILQTLHRSISNYFSCHNRIVLTNSSIITVYSNSEFKLLNKEKFHQFFIQNDLGLQDSDVQILKNSIRTRLKDDPIFKTGVFEFQSFL